ncbi:hypothetical protein [Thioalkalivibrio sp. ALJ7]|uniref:hypothetical protein n=1 Tax=Thioalkalivibrio sp. ALJ7 TaxID=1158756 RepID=UPI00036BD02F|nr:hypothetical protein [Thioalkalivibrio sp. ALJ7]
MKLPFLGEWWLPEKLRPSRLEHGAHLGVINQADGVVNYEGRQSTPETSANAKVGPHLTQSSHSPEAIGVLGVNHSSQAKNDALEGRNTGLSATVSALQGQHLTPFRFERMQWSERRFASLGGRLK